MPMSPLDASFIFLPLLLLGYTLVVNVDVDILLAVGNNLVQFLALECGQLLERIGNDSQRRVDLRLGDDQRWRETDDVLVCRFRLLQH
jgi:hypothetical protein